MRCIERRARRCAARAAPTHAARRRREADLAFDRAIDTLWIAAQPIVSVRERRVVAFRSARALAGAVASARRRDHGAAPSGSVACARSSDASASTPPRSRRRVARRRDAPREPPPERARRSRAHRGGRAARPRSRRASRSRSPSARASSPRGSRVDAIRMLAAARSSHRGRRSRRGLRGPHEPRDVAAGHREARHGAHSQRRHRRRRARSSSPRSSRSRGSSKCASSPKASSRWPSASTSCRSGATGCRATSSRDRTRRFPTCAGPPRSLPKRAKLRPCARGQALGIVCAACGGHPTQFGSDSGTGGDGIAVRKRRRPDRSTTPVCRSTDGGAGAPTPRSSST